VKWLLPICSKQQFPATLIAEYPSGRILSGKNIDTSRPMAALTKLLVAYEAVNQDFNLAKSSVYSTTKQKATGRLLPLKNGATLKNIDLLHAMIVGSTNNTARMVAQNSGVSEAELINKIKTRLTNWGADSTTIADVTGLDPKNKSTPRNLLKIATKILEDSTIKTALGKATYSFKEASNKTTHSVTGLVVSAPANTKNYKILASKTGSTEEAGVVTMVLVESIKTKKQYTIITMGGKDLKNAEALKMANWVTSGNVQLTNKTK
jgi:D-alanyl-D-alanine endopeptidase (penicillin-binding protein 7)